MRNRAILKWPGYPVERLSPAGGDFPERWRASLSAEYARLDPSPPPEGPRSRRWRAQVNLPEPELAGRREP